MRVRPIAILVIGLMVTAKGQEPAPTVELLGRVRDGDIRAVERLLRSGVDPNTRDTSGATALMYAAAFAPQAAMQALLRAGAEVNAANQSGATALMWASHDPEKVRLLLARGANVHAARPDGFSAVLGAALRGNRQVVEMLIVAGAEARKGSATAPWPLTLTQIALTTNDPASRPDFESRLRRMARQRSIDPRASGRGKLHCDSRKALVMARNAAGSAGESRTGGLEARQCQFHGVSCLSRT